jgi:hypothetical protein
MTTAHPAGDAAAPYLGGQVTALLRRVASSNLPGDLDGLFARHVLADSVDLVWRVDPMTDSWLVDHDDELEDAGPLAAVGYGMSPATSVSIELSPRVCAGLKRLKQRDLFRAGRLTFLHDSRMLLGMGLATLSVQREMPDAVAWLAATLQDPRLEPADRFHDLIQQHVLALLSGQQAQPVNIKSLHTGPEHALAYWMIIQGVAHLSDPADDRQLQARVLHAATLCDPADLAIPQAALLAWATVHIAATSIDQLVLSRTHLSLLLNRFEPAMRRWRWDDPENRKTAPIQWPITSEREIQDILWIMLRSVFDDVVDEDTLPKFGHGSTRADFGLPGLRTLVEAKYAYKGTDFKKIEQEVMVDSIAYLKRTDHYREIVVFIYDASASVEQHDLTRRALLEVDGISEVIIASRPGVLAASNVAKTARKAAKKTAPG